MELPERERAILQLRYGLTDGRRRTLEEVGVTFGITRERTRQIEAEALRHLRSPGVGARLQAYLEAATSRSAGPGSGAAWFHIGRAAAQWRGRPSVCWARLDLV